MTRGRPSSYSPEVADRICARLAAGESLRAICRDDDMPAAPTVLGWRETQAGFSERYASARETGCLCLADELLEIADDGRNDWMAAQDDEGGPGYRLNGEHTTRTRLRLDTRKWLLSKMLPKQFGDKTLHTGGDGESPVALNVFTGVPRP
jgi:hypothetical protein